MMKKINSEILIKKLIPVIYKAGSLSIKYSKKLKVFVKKDGTPVTNGDLEVDKILQNFLKKITPNIEIVSEETIKITKVKKRETFWLIDPIDGTNSYIKGGSEYTINVGLIINRKPMAGIVYAPKKKRLFYAYGKKKDDEVFNKIKKIKLNCRKKLIRERVALTNSTLPSKMTGRLLKKHNINKFVSMRSSLKFCVIASSEFDLYSAKSRAREWDYAAGHAIAEGAGAIVRTLKNKKILYGKRNFKNPSLLVRRNSKI